MASRKVPYRHRESNQSDDQDGERIPTHERGLPQIITSEDQEEFETEQIKVSREYLHYHGISTRDDYTEE